MTGTGGQYDFDDVIQNENTFLSLLSNQIISIKPSGYNITITIDKKTAQVMKEEYQERIAIIQKKLNNDVSRLEENIKKTGARFRMHPRMILLFINKMGRSGFERYIACCSTPEQHDGESITDNAANIDFIYFLLSHGYLSTDYMAYRSVFMR